MVAERSGLIRIYNTETLRPMYTLLTADPANESISRSILSFDWCQTNPEVVIATTRSEIVFWNSSNSLSQPLVQKSSFGTRQTPGKIKAACF